MAFNRATEARAALEAADAAKIAPVPVKVETEDPAPPEAPSNESLVSALAKFVNQAEDGPIRQQSVAKAIICTPWNPTGSKKRPKLARVTRMNGNRLPERMMSAEEITLLNALQPGKYGPNKKWVVMQTDGEDEGSAIDLFVPNKTQSDRLETAVAAGTGDLAGILKRIVTEQAESQPRA